MHTHTYIYYTHKRVHCLIFTHLFTVAHLTRRYKKPIASGSIESWTLPHHRPCKMVARVSRVSSAWIPGTCPAVARLYPEAMGGFDTYKGGV
jgi:hypothetical protein